MAAGRELLECEDITMFFGGLAALKGVSLTCSEGEILGLIGPNGSGKSTLFNVITGFLRPQTGRVHFRGREITGAKPHQVCRLGIARTYQLVRPFPSLTARENVLAGLAFGAGGRAGAGDDAQAMVDDLVARVGLAEKADWRAEHLTLVERRRLEIARALAGRPELLLLDEVVAGLNPAETAALLSLIAAIRESGVTVILIEHNMRVITGLSDRVVVLHHGEKLAEGPPEEVLRHAEVISAYLGQVGPEASFGPATGQPRTTGVDA